MTTDRTDTRLPGELLGRQEAEALVLEHLPLAEAIARRYFRRDPARDEDLVQVAYIGLVKAARRFDADRGGPFAAFASPTISGEIKRHLRDHGWFVRPPRPVQELRARVAEAVPRLAQELGHGPSVPELTADLGASDELVREAIACQNHLRPASLDALVGIDHETSLGDIIPAEDGSLERAESAAILSTALRVLSPRDRRVLQLRFAEDLTQQEIAEAVGVTQMQVSRILKRSLELLRDRIVHGEPSTEQAGRRRIA
ncbi:sigma-70 family RNA polymerase sigma factor [Plantibacter cousiniae (nom. nud.)]|uniref:RNA polymerase, sigma 28 subunit, SigD/FliA/WhiG n=1 Tax=Plantibacter cousiniae (nom. nud.) TaxID=199709 RepID=A0ABY1LHU0_9MICO|nr:sigma-70 family RNA polymerase sigma factor [Plantibacter cousiniae]SKC42343.1 RNA polymerase, sigma 28 subunit, SigD/FliA/WhiG [Plantibacter cousiniae]